MKPVTHCGFRIGDTEFSVLDSVERGFTIEDKPLLINLFLTFVDRIKNNELISLLLKIINPS